MNININKIKLEKLNDEVIKYYLEMFESGEFVPYEVLGTIVEFLKTIKKD